MNRLEYPTSAATGHLLPSFPAAALPPALRRYVEGESAASQTPLDLAATWALGVCSAAIRGKVHIEARAGFSQPASLFVAAITTGTDREANLFTRIRRPLEMLEVGRIKAARRVQAEEESRLRQAHLRLKQLEREFSRPQAFKLAQEIADNPLPPVPRTILDDGTTVKLDQVLANQQGRIARFSGEVAARELLSGTTARTHLARHELYRKGFRGESMIVDLRGGARVPLQQTAITCTCAIPWRAIEAVHKRRHQGRGVADCFLFAMPESNLGHRQLASAPLAEEITDQYTQLLEKLEAIEGRATLRLTDEARQRFETWEAEVEMMLAPDGPLAALPAWGDNLPSNTLRIAALLHCLENSPEEQVTRGTIEAAISIARYYLSHSIAALEVMQSPETQTQGTSQSQASSTETSPQAAPPQPVPPATSSEAPPAVPQASPSSPQRLTPRTPLPGQHLDPPTASTGSDPPRPGRPPRKFRGHPIGSGRKKR